MENLKLPEHVVVIPDGNRRWARERGQKPWEGHLAGADRIEELVRKALEMKIKNISFWGSSLGNLEKRSEKILTLLCENPDRPARELATALNLSPRAVEKQIAQEQRQAAAMNADAAMDWDMWGPDPWY